MVERVSCTECGSLILLATSESNGGLCMPCKRGYRKNIEASKHRKEIEKKERDSPSRKHWLWLVDLINNSSSGFNSLSIANQLYFSVGLLEGDVFNGGFDQYFHNSSADYYLYAVHGLLEMGAIKSHELLIKAKEELFGADDVPCDRKSRIALLVAKQLSTLGVENQTNKLDELDNLFWKDPDKLRQCATNFAEKQGLYNYDAGLKNSMP